MTEIATSSSMRVNPRQACDGTLNRSDRRERWCAGTATHECSGGGFAILQDGECRPAVRHCIGFDRRCGNENWQIGRSLKVGQLSGWPESTGQARGFFALVVPQAGKEKAARADEAKEQLGIVWLGSHQQAADQQRDRL